MGAAETGAARLAVRGVAMLLTKSVLLSGGLAGGTGLLALGGGGAALLLLLLLVGGLLLSLGTAHAAESTLSLVEETVHC